MLCGCGEPCALLGVSGEVAPHPGLEKAGYRYSPVGCAVMRWTPPLTVPPTADHSWRHTATPGGCDALRIQARFGRRPENITLSFYRTTCGGKCSRSLDQSCPAAGSERAECGEHHTITMKKSEVEDGATIFHLALSNQRREYSVQAACAAQKVKPLFQ